MPIKSRNTKINKNREMLFGNADMIITFEGSSGAGKTLLSNYICDYLKKIGYRCVTNNEQWSAKRYNEFGILFDEIHILNARENIDVLISKQGE